MSHPTCTLCILAAGMGSRYGGLKQIDPLHNGQILFEYTIYDALRAGFTHIVILIRRDFEREFMERFGSRIAAGVRNRGGSVDFVFQEGLGELPAYRGKMWGTGHAMLCMKNVVDSPFAAVNADDYYGRESFEELYRYFSGLSYDPDGAEHAIVAFQLRNVLSPYGTVARGICSVSGDGFLEDVRETLNIGWSGGRIVCPVDGGERELPPGATVSMNFWGFNQTIFPAIEAGFETFLKEVEAARDPKKEYFLPFRVDELIKRRDIAVRVLQTGSRWFGMTYENDRDDVRAEIRAMTEAGIYPSNLWA